MIFVSPDIPEELTDLGVVVGLIHQNNGDLTLNDQWFADPVGEMRGVLTDDARRDALLERAAELFGLVTDGLDLPSVGDNVSWIPIVEFASGAVSGSLHVIVDMRNADPIVAAGAQIWVRRDGVDASVTVQVPLVVAGQGGLELLLGTATGGIEVAATVLVDGLGVPGVVELDGICLSALLPTNGGDPVVTVVAKNLALPGGVPEDLALGDVLDLLDELGPAAVQMFVSLISSFGADAPQAVRDLLALIGYGDDPAIPPLPITDIVVRGLSALREWVSEIVANGIADWLARLGAFLTEDGAPAIQPVGSGVADDPYRVCVELSSGGVDLEACLTLVVEADGPSGTTALIPGASIHAVADDTLPAVLIGSMTFGRLLLDQAFTIALGPTVRATAEVGDGALVSTQVDSVTVSIGSIVGGLSYTPATGLIPVIEARDVDADGTVYDAVDLSDADAVIDAATGGLSQVLLDALGIADVPQTHALAILAGLVAPDGDPTWPTVSLASFFADPIGAVGCYHVDVLSVAGRYQTIVEQLAVLLGLDDPPASGTGTETDPWTVVLFDNENSADPVQGRVDLAVWADGDPLTVHVAIASHPSFEVANANAGVTLRTTILDAHLPSEDRCPAPVELVWGREHRAIMTLTDAVLSIEPITFSSDRIDLGLRLDRTDGLAPHFVAHNALVTIDGTPFPLGDIDLGELPDFGDLPWPVLEQLVGDWLRGSGVPLADELASLTGWRPGGSLPFTLPQLPDLRLDAPQLPSIDLQSLLTEPAGALTDWLFSLFGGPGTGTDIEFPEFLVAIGRFAEILAGDHPSISLDGCGTYDNPWAICLAGTPIELLAWLDPDGPQLGSVVGISDHLLAQDVLTGTDPEAALGLLARAAGLIPNIRERLGDVNDLIAGLRDLRDLLEGDAFVTADSQRVEGWDEHSMQPTAHLLEPGTFVMPPSVVDTTPDAGWIFVSSSAIPTAPWPDQSQMTTIDLTEPGIRPESIDLSHVVAGSTWHVLLPARAAAVVPAEPDVAGVDRLAQRLRRAIDHIHGIVGGDLAVIAHSTAGQVARIVASEPASETNVRHVVTVGTPHGGASFEFLDRPETAGALRTLARLRSLLEETADHSDIAALTDLADSLDHALDPYLPTDGGALDHAPLPVADFAVPAPYPDLDAGTNGHAVVGSVIAADLDAALIAFVQHVIEAGLDSLPTGETVTHLGVGVRARLIPPDRSPGALSASISARVDLHRFRLGPGAAPPQPVPFVSADLELRRNGGWLVGGPDPGLSPGAPRDPRARWLEAHLRADPTALSAGTVEVVVHDASVFGAHRDRWQVDLQQLEAGLTLLPEVRILLGEVAAGLGVLVTDTTVERFASLLVELGLAEHVDQRLGLVTDAFERFIIDPVGEIRGRLAGAGPAVRGALARLLPIEFGPASHRLDLGPLFDVALQLEGGFATCATLEIANVPVADLLAVSGTATVCVDGSTNAEVVVTSIDPPGPLGQVVVDIAAEFGGVLDPTGDVVVSVRSEAEADLPRLLLEPIPLFPTPPLPDLAEVALHLLAGDIGRRALEFMRLQLADPDPLDRLIVVSGLEGGDGRVLNVGPVLMRPGAYLSSPLSLGMPASPDIPYVPCLSGTDMSTLLQAVADLLGVPTTGSLPLPWGASVRVAAESAGGVQLIVGWDAPTTVGPTTIDGRVTLDVGCGLDVSAAVNAAIEVSGPGLDFVRLDLSVDVETALDLTVQPAGGQEIHLGLLPLFTGLESLDASAVAHAILPLVLDAAAAEATIGASVGAFGDALNLRVAGRFDGPQLQALAADPAGRLRVAAIETAFPTLEPLWEAWFGAANVSSTPNSLSVEVADGVSFEIGVPLRLCLELSGFEPLDGTSIDAEICVKADPATPLTVRVEVEVIDPTLLLVGGVSLFPRLAFFAGSTATLPPDGSDRFEGGLWIDEPAEPIRRGLFAKVPTGGATAIVCRVGDNDDPDLGACLDAALETWIMPLALELLLAIPEIQTFLHGSIAQGATTIGALLEQARIIEPGGLHLDPGFTDHIVDRLACLGGAVVEAFAPLGNIDVSPLTFAFDAAAGDFGFTLGLGEDLHLLTVGDVRLSITAPADTAAGAGVAVTLFSLDADCVPTFAPALAVTDVGLRLDHPTGGKLVDLLASVDAIEVLANLSLGQGNDDGSVEFGFDNLTLPMGIAQGTNPVAAKILSSETEEGDRGDAEELAPALSPRVEIATFPTPSVVFRLDTGDPPWWLPIQRAFGPIYVEQVGADTVEENGELVQIVFLLDGEVSLAGLIVAADDLSLTIPVATASDLTTWGIDLEALAVGYSGSGVNLAGGFRKNTTPQGIEYVGMAQLDIFEYGLSAIGAYGEFSDPSAPGTTYTSMFVFAALSAPLGGPPFFFVTGIGAGLGLNRELVLPEDVVDIPGFPLVAAMDGSSGFSTDPMGALEDVSTAFPGRRGTFWVAAGVRFTSFVLLETVAVLAVEIGDGVEVALLGVSHAALPDASTPVAFIELALIARFSTEEGVLWVQAQLTDNSWLLDEDCRLTGGFAFVVWFNRGEFVFTVGGYHPRFDVPDYYPVVPPVGYNWSVDNALVIKGESYFALTSSAIMAGAGFEASYTTSTVWASLSAGVDVLVEWDPLFYDISAYVRVSAGIDVRICLVLCARVRMSFSMGASVRVWGPKLQGKVKLELGPIDVTVKFGSGAKDDVLTIRWNEFVSRYLIQGNPAGESMGISILRGLLTPDTGEQTETDDGTFAKPWRVLPEFTMRSETRAASTTVEAAGTRSESQPTVPSTVDAAPVGATNLTSTFTVVVRDDGGNEVVGLEVEAFQISKLPDAAWKYVARESRAPAADYVNAFSGATLKAQLEVADDDIEVSLDLIDGSLIIHPLPYFDEIDDRNDPELVALLTGGDAFLAIAAGIEDIYAAAATGLGEYSPPSLATLQADRVSPPGSLP